MRLQTNKIQIKLREDQNDYRSVKRDQVVSKNQKMKPKVLDKMRKTQASFTRHGSLIVTHTTDNSLFDEFETNPLTNISKNGLINSNLNLHKMRLVKQIKAQRQRQSISSQGTRREDLEVCLEGQKLVPSRLSPLNQRPQTTMQLNLEKELRKSGKKIRIFTKHIKDGPLRNYFSSQR